MYEKEGLNRSELAYRMGVFLWSIITAACAGYLRSAFVEHVRFSSGVIDQLMNRFMLILAFCYLPLVAWCELIDALCAKMARFDARYDLPITTLHCFEINDGMVTDYGKIKLRNSSTRSGWTRNRIARIVLILALTCVAIYVVLFCPWTDGMAFLACLALNASLIAMFLVAVIVILYDYMAAKAVRK